MQFNLSRENKIILLGLLGVLFIVGLLLLFGGGEDDRQADETSERPGFLVQDDDDQTDGDTTSPTLGFETDPGLFDGERVRFPTLGEESEFGGGTTGSTQEQGMAHPSETETGEQTTAEEDGEAESNISVTSPTWGDSWERGSTQTVRWEATSDINSVNVKLMPSRLFMCENDPICEDDFLERVQPLSLVENVENTGRFEWTLGESIREDLLIPSKYTVLVEDTESDTAGVSRSFAVTGEIPEIALPMPDDSDFEMDLLSESDLPDDVSVADLEEKGISIEDLEANVISSMEERIEKSRREDFYIFTPHDPDELPFQASIMEYIKGTPAYMPIMWMPSAEVFRVDIYLRERGCGSCSPYQIAANKLNSGLFGWDVGQTVNDEEIPNGEYEVYVQSSSDPNMKSSPKPLNLVN